MKSSRSDRVHYELFIINRYLDHRFSVGNSVTRFSALMLPLIRGFLLKTARRAFITDIIVKPQGVHQ